MSRFPKRQQVSETTGVFTAPDNTRAARGWGYPPRLWAQCGLSCCALPNPPPFLGLTDADTSLWCPSLQEVTAAFHRLGTHSPALQPPGPLQHDGR